MFNRVVSRMERIRATNLEEEFDRLAGQNRLGDNNGLRLRRSISWAAKAENSLREEDIDLALILYWIAFNSLYSRISNVRMNERKDFHGFFKSLIALDKEHTIHDILWSRFSEEVRNLVEDKYVFQPFWDQLHAPQEDGAGWKEHFEQANRATLTALEKRNTPQLLSLVFERLYTLRNQLMHGSATYQSSVNRKQVYNGGMILSYVVPRFIELVLENPHIDLGEPNYPLVNV